MSQLAYKNTVGECQNTQHTQAKWPLVLFLIHKSDYLITEDNEVRQTQLTVRKSILTVPSHIPLHVSHRKGKVGPVYQQDLTRDCPQDSSETDHPLGLI